MLRRGQLKFFWSQHLPLVETPIEVVESPVSVEAVTPEAVSDAAVEAIVEAVELAPLAPVE
jgi:hypothetical protein